MLNSVTVIPRTHGERCIYHAVLADCFLYLNSRYTINAFFKYVHLLYPLHLYLAALISNSRGSRFSTLRGRRDASSQTPKTSRHLPGRTHTPRRLGFFVTGVQLLHRALDFYYPISILFPKKHPHNSHSQLLSLPGLKSNHVCHSHTSKTAERTGGQNNHRSLYTKYSPLSNSS